MPITHNRGGRGGTLAIPASMIFPDAITRDDYFTTNPSKLKADVSVVVNNQLQKYDGSSWIDISPVVKGQSGNDAPEMLIQYSASGNSGWSETLNIATHKYWRWSTDNGVTWSPNFIRFSGDGTGTGVPEPYSMIVGNNGKLQLFKDGELIQEQDETGAWLATSVTTGTGSLHLGDLHSVGSGGENVVFVNTDSNIAWYPSWSGLSIDGTQTIPMSARTHIDSINTEPLGDVATTGGIDFSDTITSPHNIALYFINVVPAETFSGRLRWVATKSTGKELSAIYFDANFVADQLETIPFKYPLWLVEGQVFTGELLKDDGTYLKVRPCATDSGRPWRALEFSMYWDNVVFHEGNAILQAQSLNSLMGADQISANAIRNFPVMSSTKLGMAKLGATMSITGSGELNTSVSPTGIKIVADETARLGIPTSGGAILAIQQDNGFTYGIEANEDTAITGNWRRIGTVATNVVSFNGRNGAVVPELGDYDQKQVKTVHDDTLVEGWFGIDNGGVYWNDGV